MYAAVAMSSAVLAAPLDLVRDCGAVYKTSETTTVQETDGNSAALLKCLQRANERSFQEFGPSAKTVLLSHEYVVQTSALVVANLTDVTLQIDGILEASVHHKEWPVDPRAAGQNNKQDLLSLLSFEQCTNLTIRGDGMVDGLGYDWWIREWNKQNPHGRPHLLQFIGVQNSEITGVQWRNAPRFHMKLDDIDSAHIHDFEIKVDILRQRSSVSKGHEEARSFQDQLKQFVYALLRRSLGKYQRVYDGLVGERTELSWPTMPLNTDGIDPAGSNVLIENVNITNFDDAVAVKPSHQGDSVARNGCSENITVRNTNVFFGVGMTIGSVPPRSNHACVRNVNFQKVKFEYPMKSIYVKTNPGTGTGEITNILYEDIDIHFPIWWNIYIGPQQMQEPDGRGPGCMTYPFGGCDTQPAIDIRNITLRRLNSRGGILPPGVIRCNETNPCTGINLEDVKIEGWWQTMNWQFITEYAHGTVNNVSPAPTLGRDSERVFQLFSVDHLFDLGSQLLNAYEQDETDVAGWQVLIGFVIWAAQMAFHHSPF